MIGSRTINLSGDDGMSADTYRWDKFAALVDRRVERLIREQQHLISRDALDAQCDERTLERQIRLHIPSPRCPIDSNSEEAYASIRSIAIGRASRIAASRRNAHTQADNYDVDPSMTTTTQGLRRSDGRILPIEVKAVRPSTGH